MGPRFQKREILRAHLELVAGERDADIEPTQVKEFAAAYERHIRLEEAQLLPLARKLLDVETLGRIGRTMAERRKK